MKVEIFKDIPGYEGIYEVSDLGNIKSKHSSNHIILVNFIGHRGYKKVNLSKKGVSKTYEVHKLIAMAFLDHKPNGNKLVVDHIDNNKLNNTLINLQVITHRDNCSKDIKNKTSKYTGVYLNKINNKWRASINVNKIKKHLGTFNTEYEAYLVYQKELKAHKNRMQRST